MDVQRLKEHIINNDFVPQILECLKCHDIKDKGEYYQCANPDGDNLNAITVYKNSLHTIDYTRNIEQKNISDIFNLVMFFQHCNFFQSLKYVCQCIGIDYYYDFNKNLPASLKLTKLLTEFSIHNDGDICIEKPIEPISEHILSYYKPYLNDMFYQDNIDYQIQKMFEVGYDEETNRITIPIRDELGNLVGVKGRYFSTNMPDYINKYLYIEPCAKGQILYGLNIAYDSIKQNNSVYVVESEKGVMQMFSGGYTNTVATCGKKITQIQVNKLSRICENIIFVYDKDVQIEELNHIADKFMNYLNIFAVIDKQNILSEKESPCDNPKKFKTLIQNGMTRLR